MSHFYSIIRWASRNSRAGMQHPPSNPHYSHTLKLNTGRCRAQPCLRWCLLRPPYLITHMMLWGQTDVPHINHHHRKSLFELSWRNTDTFMELVTFLSPWAFFNGTNSSFSALPELLGWRLLFLKRDLLSLNQLSLNGLARLPVALWALGDPSCNGERESCVLGWNGSITKPH